MTALLVALGAAVGAPMRYLVDRAIRSRYGGLLPCGTIAVNVAASLLLGVLTGVASSADSAPGALLGTGFCGALSTYSAFGYENLRLTQEGDRGAATANVALSLGAGLGAAAVGWWLAAALS